MKRILSLTFCLGLALTVVAHADDKDKKHAKQAARATAVAPHNAARVSRQNVNVQRNVQHNAQIQRNVQARQNLRIQHQHANIQQNNNAAALNARQWNRRNQNTVVANQNNRVITRNNNRVNTQNYNREIARNNNRIVARNNNVTIRNRNSWYEASRRFNWHERHDRDWWRRNHGNSRFVLFGGGYYFWDNNYWYPAYGYDPSYSRYTYDEPIYGYNQYEPGQVISNVQSQLQNEGYYNGDVDGLIGPMTRQALARYQADHGLYVTRAIDEPTLESLGLS